MENDPATGRRVGTVNPLGGDAMGVTPGEVQPFLLGVRFPADRDGLLRALREKNAPAPVIAAIDQIESRTYKHMQEVMAAYGRAVNGP